MDAWLAAVMEERLKFEDKLILANVGIWLNALGAKALREKHALPRD